MTQNLQQEIHKELTTFSGQTFNSPEESHRWLKEALTRIAEKTVEAVRVEKLKGLVPRSFSEHDKGFNQAVTEQNKRASAWLGKDN